MASELRTSGEDLKEIAVGIFSIGGLNFPANVRITTR
jgi:hypothetical protein